VSKLEELDYPVWQRDEFKAVVVGVQARPSMWIAVNCGPTTFTRGVFVVQVFSVGVLVAECFGESLLSKFRHRRRVSECVPLTVEPPNAGKIPGIEGMAFDFVPCGRFLTVPLILAPGTLLPALGRCNGGYNPSVVVSTGELIATHRLLAFSRLRVRPFGRNEAHRSHQSK
jgi:hypothetical protein